MNVELSDQHPITDTDLERYRSELTGYCYRMLGSLFEADDAVQETMLRAWKAADRFEGRSSVRSWVYRIATNVCLDQLNGRNRRARPMDLHTASGVDATLSTRTAEAWIEPLPDTLADPGAQAADRDSVRLAFVAALQMLPPRQRAALILCEVLDWKAAEAAQFLDSSVASVNSALQRARATLASVGLDSMPARPSLDDAQQHLLDRYLEAFERYDMTALALLIHEDARQSMPPIEQWVAGRADILAFWAGPGHECEGSRLVRTTDANGRPAFAQYRRAPQGGYHAWALQVIELTGEAITEFSMFLDVDRVFPRFGLPLDLDADGNPS